MLLLLFWGASVYLQTDRMNMKGKIQVEFPPHPSKDNSNMINIDVAIYYYKSVHLSIHPNIFSHLAQ